MRFGTRGVGARWRKRRQEKSRGAVLVEFALISFLLFTLLFGIIEFGWAFTQYLDTRHGARESARLVAVNYEPTGTATPSEQTRAIVDETCDRMDSSTTVAVRITRTGATVNDSATVTVRSNLDTFTGFFPVIEGKQLTSTVAIRLEQSAEWVQTADVTGAPTPDADGFLACT